MGSSPVPTVHPLLGVHTSLPFVLTLTWISFILFAWFILNIVIFSLGETYIPNLIDMGDPTTSITASSLLPLEVYTVTCFTIQVIIFLATHAATGFALKEHTRGARYFAVALSTMGALVWLLQGSFVYSSYYDTNTWCNSDMQGVYCRSARVVSAFAISVELGQILNMAYTWMLFLAPTFRRLQDAADRKMNRPQKEYLWAWFPAEAKDLDNAYIMEEEDKALVGDDVHRLNTAWTVRMLSRRIFVLTLLSLFGYAIFALSYIVVSANMASVYSPATDPVFTMSGRFFSLLLALSIAVSGYSAFHRKRALVAGSWLLSVFTSFSFWAFFISTSRRVAQLSDVSQIGALEPSLVEIDAQRGMAIGVGIITVTQTLLALTLKQKYVTYLETKASQRQIDLSKNHPYPPFQKDGTHRFNSSVGAFTFDKFINFTFGLQVFFGLIWAIVEVVGQSTGGLMDAVFDSSNSYAFSLYSITAETAFIFIFSNIFIVASYGSIYYATRRLHQGAWLAALRVNVVCLCGWWLLIWPIAFNSAYSSGVSASVFCSLADMLDSVSNVWCDQSKGAGTIAVIQGLISFVLALYCLHHYRVAAQKKDNQHITVTTRPSRIFHGVSLIAQLGLCIWAFAAIKQGYQTETWTDFHAAFNSFGNQSITGTFTAGYVAIGYSVVSAQQVIAAAPSIFDVVTYATAAGVVILYGFTTWINSLTAESPFGHSSRAMRSFSSVLSLSVFFFLFPTFIEVCRWINTNPLTSPNDDPSGDATLATSLSSAQSGIGAGVIIMTWGVCSDFFCGLWLLFTHSKNDALDLSVLDQQVHVYRNDANYGDVEKGSNKTFE